MKSLGLARKKEVVIRNLYVVKILCSKLLSWSGVQITKCHAIILTQGHFTQIQRLFLRLKVKCQTEQGCSIYICIPGKSNNFPGHMTHILNSCGRYVHLWSATFWNISIGKQSTQTERLFWLFSSPSVKSRLTCTARANKQFRAKQILAHCCLLLKEPYSMWALE